MRPTRHSAVEIARAARCGPCRKCGPHRTLEQRDSLRQMGNAMRFRTAVTGLLFACVIGAAPAFAQGPAPGSCANPNALGVSRTVEIDTTGGPGFGFEHYKEYDFLSLKEVVLTFDDGPQVGYTHAILRALADQRVKATFFSSSARWRPVFPRSCATWPRPAIPSARIPGRTSRLASSRPRPTGRRRSRKASAPCIAPSAVRSRHSSATEA